MQHAHVIPFLHSGHGNKNCREFHLQIVRGTGFKCKNDFRHGSTLRFVDGHCKSQFKGEQIQELHRTNRIKVAWASNLVIIAVRTLQVWKYRNDDLLLTVIKRCTNVGVEQAFASIVSVIHQLDAF